MILEDYIEQHARLCPQKTAIVFGEEKCSYAELWERVSRRMKELKHIDRGQVCCLRAVTSIDFLISYFALHKVGGVAVPLEKSLPDETYKIISEKMCSYKVPEGAADILYTTGTTGKSKGVIISHRTILADAENLIDGQGFSRDLAFVINGPLNHIGSLSKIYPVIMLGGTVILVDGLKDINKFFEAFNYPAAKMATFLVPASIRMLIQFSSEKIKALAEKMEFIETGAAAISQSDMLELCKLLPLTRLYNTYASTETGIICTYNYNDGKCVSGCLGKPMKHSRVTISDKGKIICYGDTLMSGYVDDPEMTASILRDGAIFTSDVGRIDECGMLHLIGREGDVINVGGFKVAPTEVEDAALAFPDVEDCVCVPVEHKITGKALKLLVVMKCEKNLDGRELALFLKSRLETYKVPLLYSQIEHVERTFNGKINRKYYIDV
ncbi:MAG: acyl--CoA ligase [Prevotella sp.]|nr:acyl--CoA ligase [Prevotella sp.]